VKKRETPPDLPESFEGALERLEDIVQELEDGQITLEDCLARYQEGIRLHRFCQERLGKVEEELARLLEDDGSLSPWSPGSTDGESPA
jgi:exodeoxyribonuclease VII small subunit